MRARTLNGSDDFATTAGAAAGTAIAPGIGTAVGAALGGFIAQLFGGGASQWDSAGPGVHDWFTAYGEQAYLDHARANPSLGAFGSVDAAKAQYLVWDHNKYGGRWNYLSDPNRSPSNLKQFFAAMGIDLQASQAKALARTGQINTLYPEDVVMLPGQGTPEAPAPVVDALEKATDAVMKGEATREQEDMVRDSLTAQDTTTTASANMIPLLLLGGALLFAANK
jgi:hypothetical protein